MHLVERIEDQISATRLPLVAITIAAVDCPDTPLILTLHWHGFIKERIAKRERVEAASYIPVPSSALQLNDRWQNLLAVDRAAMEAAWELGAWDIARAERRSCRRPGASASEAVECLQAFGSFPFGLEGHQMVVAEAPDAGELIQDAFGYAFEAKLRVIGVGKSVRLVPHPLQQLQRSGVMADPQWLTFPGPIDLLELLGQAQIDLLELDGTVVASAGKPRSPCSGSQGFCASFSPTQ